jgi:uncharacterized protein (TIGR03089 family)
VEPNKPRQRKAHHDAIAVIVDDNRRISHDVDWGGHRVNWNALDVERACYCTDCDRERVTDCIPRRHGAGSLWRVAVPGFGADLSRRSSRAPGEPAVTLYAPDGRVELSLASLANWAAKVHGWASDDMGLSPGACAGLDLPPHWITIAVALGLLSAGINVVWRADIAVDLAVVADPTSATASRTRDVAVVPTDLWAMARADTPAGEVDLVGEARVQPDQRSPEPNEGVLLNCRPLAAADVSVLLVDVLGWNADILASILTTITNSGSVVVVTGVESDAPAKAERVTHRIGDGGIIAGWAGDCR